MMYHKNCLLNTNICAKFQANQKTFVTAILRQMDRQYYRTQKLLGLQKRGLTKILATIFFGGKCFKNGVTEFYTTMNFHT